MSRRALWLTAALLIALPLHAGMLLRPEVLPQSVVLDTQRLSEADPVQVSADFVDQVIRDLPVQPYLDYFSALDAALLDARLDTQSRQLAFWINVYNGYTQHFLKSDPSLYLANRSRYFGLDQIAIAGTRVSLEDIEHGVLRRGATIYTLGHVRLLWLRRAFVRRFALVSVDYRIHFALNCGARSCPAVLPYTAEAVDQQLDASSRHYLQRESQFDASTHTVAVPALLRWFSADFDGGSARAKRDILRRHGVLAADAAPRLTYRPYDWTLQIENYAVYAPDAVP